MKIKKLPRINFFLSWGIFILTLKTFLSYSYVIPISSSFDTILSVLGSLMFSIKIITDRYSKKTILAYLIICLISLFICNNIGSLQLFITVLTVLAIRKEELKNIIEFIYKLEIIFFVSIIMLSLLQYFLSNQQLFIVANGVNRYKFGFSHPNVLSAIVLNLILMYFWLNFEKLNNVKITFTIFLELISFCFTKTRTSLLMLIMIVFIIKFFYKGKKNNLLKRMVIIIIPVLSILFYFFIKNFQSGNAFILFLNKALTGRIMLGNYAYNRVGLTFFGQNISSMISNVQWDSVYQFTSFTFDNFYTSSMMNFGIIVILLVEVVFILLSSLNNNKVNIFLLSWALLGITEIHGINCYMFFSLLQAVLLLQTKNKGLFYHKSNKMIKREILR